MRLAPTFGYIALVMLGLLGCASEDATGNDEKPNTNASKNDDTGQTEQADGKSSGPEFDAKFDPNDPKKDPTPPNGDQCIDNGDPGGAENVATALPDTDDCDDNEKTFNGIVKGAVDVDFYKLSATDKGISLSHPFGCGLDTTFEAETAGTELCVFARCKSSTTDAVTGCIEGTAATSEIGMKGCCAAAPGKAIPEWDCDSGGTDDDSADFFLRVRQINGDKCLPYRVKYRF